MECFTLKTNLVTEFYNNYLIDLNKDIFCALNYFKEKKQLDLYHCLKNRIETIQRNGIGYLDVIINDYDVKKISQLGDMHNKGKCTVLIETDLEKFICKPVVNTELMIFHQEILKILNFKGDFDFGLLTINTKNHGYSRIEYIENEPCKDINKFAYHYGSLLFVLVLLKGVDFHSENIFCVDSSPVVIDCESLFYPIISNAKPYDVTATSLIQTKSNLRSTMQSLQLPFDQIKKGINSAYHLIKENELIFRKMILTYSEKRRRMIFKPTNYYYTILKNSTHPSLMIDIKKRSLYLRNSLRGTHEISSAIIESEIRDLLNFEIPYFYYENKTLFDSINAEIKQEFLQSSTNEILTDLACLSVFKNNLIKQMEAA